MAINEQEKCLLRKGKDKMQDEAFTTEEHKNIKCYNCHKKGHYKLQCWAKDGGNEVYGPYTNNSDSKEKEEKDDANAAVVESADKSWAAMLDGDKASNEDKFCNTLSALTDGAALIKVKLYDLDASQHMSPFSHHFTNLHLICPHPITTANNCVLFAISAGDLKIDVSNGALSISVTLKDTLYIPDMGMTVVSVSHITAAGHSVTLKVKSCQIKNKSGKIVGDIPASPNGLYKVEHAPAEVAAAEPDNIPMVHHSQLSDNTTHSLIFTDVATELQLIDPISSFPSICDPCDYVKTTPAPALALSMCKSAQLASKSSLQVHSQQFKSA